MSNKSGYGEFLSLGEIYTNEIKPIQKLRQELRQKLKSIINKPITNKNDGRVAYLPNKNINKIYSDKALQKSLNNGFTQDEHIKTAEHLKELYENSIFKETTKDKSGADNLMIHRYNKTININGVNANALITLKETIKGQYKGNKIYTLELEGLEKIGKL